MHAVAVNRAVNSVKNDNEDCITPIGERRSKAGKRATEGMLGANSSVALCRCRSGRGQFRVGPACHIIFQIVAVA
jgi:hypothetical protein